MNQTECRPADAAVKRPHVDIIYNTTLICPWDCAVCCVDAVHVQRRNGRLIMRSDGLATQTEHEIDPTVGNVYQQAARIRQERGLELTLAQKRQVIDNLEGFDARVDISGGDALVLHENYELIQYAAAKLGRHNVTLTVTGAGSAHFKPEQLAPYIAEFNFTFDAESISDVANRPNGYALGNLKKGAEMAAIGCSTRAELPLSRGILNRDHLARIYQVLHDHGIHKLLLMRLFPVGRGGGLQDEVPSPAEYQEAIDTLRELELRYLTPKLKLQCALKHLSPAYSSGLNPCDLLHESFGLMADGTLLASPWAINGRGRALDDSFVLGNLAKSRLADILATERVIAMRRQLDENFGHCKIFSFLNSTRADKASRMFDTADPLYAERPYAPRRAVSDAAMPLSVPAE